jgi:hypothetical protein
MAWFAPVCRSSGGRSAVSSSSGTAAGVGLDDRRVEVGDRRAGVTTTGAGGRSPGRARPRGSRRSARRPRRAGGSRVVVQRHRERRRARPGREHRVGDAAAGELVDDDERQAWDGFWARTAQLPSSGVEVGGAARAGALEQLERSSARGRPGRGRLVEQAASGATRGPRGGRRGGERPVGDVGGQQRRGAEPAGEGQLGQRRGERHPGGEPDRGLQRRGHHRRQPGGVDDLERRWTPPSGWTLTTTTSAASSPAIRSGSSAVRTDSSAASGTSTRRRTSRSSSRVRHGCSTYSSPPAAASSRRSRARRSRRPRRRWRRPGSPRRAERVADRRDPLDVGGQVLAGFGDLDLGGRQPLRPPASCARRRGRPPGRWC